MNVNSGITSEITLAQCVLAVLELKQWIIASCFCQNFMLIHSNFLNRNFETDVEFRNMNDLTFTFSPHFGSGKQTLDVNTNTSY